jgi:hypothetical protein
MAFTFNWDPNRPPGRVEDYAAQAGDPPTSSLVAAFEQQDLSASDAIVLRGYLGRSDIVKRARDYLTRARSDRIAAMREAALARGVSSYQTKQLADAMEDQAKDNVAAFRAAAAAAGISLADANALAADAAVGEVVDINSLLQSLDSIKTTVAQHIPWRLYLTPRLDRYVDFHRSSLIAWRQEPRAERQDACTVWLRVFEKGAQIPIPYLLRHETTLVPSFATWINGQLVDDHPDESASGGAWADQAISGSYKTGPHCANRTGPRCMW